MDEIKKKIDLVTKLFYYINGKDKFVSDYSKLPS